MVTAQRVLAYLLGLIQLFSAIDQSFGLEKKADK
jgi:hypothetical protein